MIQKLVNRFSYLDSLVRKRATGSPKELAKRLGITERAWYKIRDELVNDLNVPLAYDSHRQTYYYAQEGQLIFQFQRRLDTNRMEELEGGRFVSAKVGSNEFRLTHSLLLNWQYSDFAHLRF